MFGKGVTRNNTPVWWEGMTAWPFEQTKTQPNHTLMLPRMWLSTTFVFQGFYSMISSWIRTNIGITLRSVNFKYFGGFEFNLMILTWIRSGVARNNSGLHTIGSQQSQYWFQTWQSWAAERELYALKLKSNQIINIQIKSRLVWNKIKSILVLNLANLSSRERVICSQA